MSQYTRNPDGSQDAAALAAGGAHLTVEDAGLVVDKTLEYGGVAALSGVERTDAEENKYQLLGGNTKAYFVGEKQPTQTSGVVHDSKTITAKEIAAWNTLTKRYIRNADRDGRRQDAIADKMAQAFHEIIDAHAVGKEEGGNITSKFDDNLLSVTNSLDQTVEMADGTGVALRNAIAAAKLDAELRSDVDPERIGVLLSRNVKTLTVADTRGTGSNELLFDRPEEVVGSGTSFSWTRHLKAGSSALAADDVVAIVGPFEDFALMGIQEDLEYEVFISGNDPDGLNLATQRAIGLQWTMAANFGVIHGEKFRRVTMPGA